MAADVQAGKAYVAVSIRDQTERGLTAIRARLNAFSSVVGSLGGGLVGAGAAIMAPLMAGLNVFSTVGDDIAKMSRRTGVGVEALSELKFAAERSGASLEGVELGFKGMANMLQAAGQGSKSSVDALRAVGLTLADLQGMAPEDQMMRIADGLSAIQDPSAKSALAMDLFGKAGRDLIPLFSEGPAGMRALREDAQRLGLTIQDESSKMAGRIGVTAEAFADLQTAAAAAGVGMGPVESGMARMGAVLATAAQGSQSSVDALAAVGVTLGELQGLSPDAQLAKIADGLAGVTDASAQSALAVQLFGEAGSGMLPLLAGGSRGMKAMRDEGNRLGAALEKMAGTLMAAEAADFGAPNAGATGGAGAKAANALAGGGGAGAADAADAAEALAAVGVTLGELQGLSPDAQLAKIADGLAGVTDASAQSALAVQLFGEAGSGMLPLLAGGSRGMKAMRDEGNRLGAALEEMAGTLMAAEAADSGAPNARATGGAGAKAANALTAGGGAGAADAADAAEALAAVGVSVKDLQGLAPEDQLARLMTGLAEIQDPAQRSAAAVRLFGQAGADLAPTLAGGEAAIRQLQQQAKLLGQTAGDSTAGKAEALNDALGDLKSVAADTFFELGAALAPAATKVANSVAEMLAGFNRFIERNPQLVTMAAKAGVVLTGLGGSLLGLAAVSKAGAFAAGSPALKFIASLGSSGIAMLASPIGLTTAALVAGGAAWLMWTDSGQAALARIKEAFGPLVETVSSSIQGIKDALMSGNLSLAAEIAGTGIKLGFLQALSGISDLLGGLFGDFGERVKSLGSDVLQGNWQAVLGDLAGLWANYWGGIIKMSMEAVDKIVGLWGDAVSKLSNWLLEASETGGVMGAVASKMLGVDMGKEADRGRLLDMKTQEMDRKAAAEMLPQLRQDLAAAKAAGNTEEVTKIQRFLTEQESKAAGSFNYDRQSSTDVARQSVDDQVAQWKDAAKGWTDTIRDGVDAGKATIDDWTQAQRDEQGTQGFDELTKGLQDRLKLLNEQAAQEKAAVTTKQAGEKIADQADAEKKVKPLDWGDTKGTFSAYNLEQQFGVGQQTRTDEQILAANQEQAKMLQEGIEIWREWFNSVRSAVPTWGFLNV